jgi:Ca2+-binding RTX toxin-like protein
MNSSILARDVRFMGISAAMLAATLAALLAVLVLAKPSGAQTDIITVEPTEVGFGAVQVGTDSEVREIYVRNTGDSRVRLGLDLLGLDLADFELVGYDLGDPNGDILRIGAGQTETLTVKFTPLTPGEKLATLNLNVAGTTTEVDLSGTGTPTDPTQQPGAQGCTIVGTNNSEVLTGTPRRDVICALGGSDRVSAMAGNDKVRGGRGNDAVRSSKGRDTLKGGVGGDRLTDKAGRRGDRLFGQGGKDRLNTKDGKRGDLLNGGPRRDKAFKDRGDRVRSI